MNIKQQLYSQCLEFVDLRHQTIQKTIHEIQVSLTTETKSSAGDKHETGRAMIQLEREKAGNQLAEIQKLKETLSKVDTSKESKTIGLGSIVYTTQANYFIAISAGELKLELEKFYAISTNTPIGQLLIGKTINETLSFRHQDFRIKRIL